MSISELTEKTLKEAKELEKEEVKVNNLPKRYKVSKYQDSIHLFRKEVLKEYCPSCANKKIGCEVQQGLEEAVNNSESFIKHFHHEFLVVVEPRSRTANYNQDRKFICTEYRHPNLDDFLNK